MRVELYKEGEVTDEPIKLELVQDGVQVSVRIVNGENDFRWSLVTFLIKEGKLVMYRNTGVADSRVKLGTGRAIVEF